MTTRTALITGASAGFGRAVALALSDRGWDLILTARTLEPLVRVRDATGAIAVAGDVADPAHRRSLATVVGDTARLDLVLNNASALGPSPMPPLADYPAAELASVLNTNVVAPLAILQLALPKLRASEGIAVNISSDAAVHAYEGWGGYGASKAALDHLTAIFAAEHPDLRVYSFDPGDMRTAMHQAAFPGEDISDRPEPETIAPALLHLLDTRPPSGRYIASDLAVPR
ncbi:NAD(P)-dependent dehydrogenase (short-subunit alcohol dehydrogenase family) [Nocardia transvalensis]|uniref:NAD(P)-dependent dehydrogenase (Short-subunit alcohol dehydrogenase family) n=1 Tax=Nocardia transvalensis TaxID=37333 RepID=A0A7W9PMA3_9NOCA|nr:SDR family oxidoreductase [Nocardia transvalensis]MBB5918681.1 NAD(P)-dependent dehydrogenase (short-subunit alcohol dehydrogenase family) [Nocardia transvalensis]